MRFSLPLVAAMCGLMACTPTEGAGTRPIDNSFRASSWSWDDGGQLVLFWHVSEQQGRPLVCGAWATDPPSGSTERLNEQVMPTLGIEADGDLLVSNLRFFTRGGTLDALEGSSANCVLSSVPWRAAYGDRDLQRIKTSRRRFEL